jgi:hypothetical protein
MAVLAVALHIWSTSTCWFSCATGIRHSTHTGFIRRTGKMIKRKGSRMVDIPETSEGESCSDVISLTGLSPGKEVVSQRKDVSNVSWQLTFCQAKKMGAPRCSIFKRVTKNAKNAPSEIAQNSVLVPWHSSFRGMPRRPLSFRP